MSVLRRALPAVLATAAVVALLASVRARPPAIAVSQQAPPPPQIAPQQPQRPMVSSRKPTVKGRVRSSNSETFTTPFSIIEVRVTLTGKELTRVETVELSGEGARTQAINDRAEPILREEALKAGSAKIDVVTGATYTSESYKLALQSAIDRARARR
jgi:uncharacterized protein with FMN-binding domain